MKTKEQLRPSSNLSNDITIDLIYGPKNLRKTGSISDFNHLQVDVFLESAKKKAIENFAGKHTERLRLYAKSLGFSDWQKLTFYLKKMADLDKRLIETFKDFDVSLNLNDFHISLEATENLSFRFELCSYNVLSKESLDDLKDLNLIPEFKNNLDSEGNYLSPKKYMHFRIYAQSWVSGLPDETLILLVQTIDLEEPIEIIFNILVESILETMSPFIEVDQCLN